MSNMALSSEKNPSHKGHDIYKMVDQIFSCSPLQFNLSDLFLEVDKRFLKT